MAMGTITIPAQIDCLAQGTEFVVACTTAAGLPLTRVREIELAAEEALANICNYAYPDHMGTIEIRCTQDDSQQLFIEFSDMGKPFNPLDVPVPDLLAEVEQRAVGGLGILFMRTLVDSVTYSRAGEKNIVQFMVRLPH
jgi:anti-sigma regulatory factor (Ser/Thr protein kinase)